MLAMKRALHIAALALLAVLTAGLAGCGTASRTPPALNQDFHPEQYFRRSPHARAHASSAAPLTLQALRNAVYRSNAFGSVTLRDGAGEGPRGERVTIGDTASGDIGDDSGDAAVILTSSFGGTGQFVDLAAVKSRNGTPDNVATTALGDRVEVNGVSIQDGMIQVDATMHEKGDPACCPTYHEVLKFKLAGGALLLVEGKPDFTYAPPR